MSSSTRRALGIGAQGRERFGERGRATDTALVWRACRRAESLALAAIGTRGRPVQRALRRRRRQRHRAAARPLAAATTSARATGTSLAAIAIIAGAAMLAQGAYGNVHVGDGLLVGVPAVGGVLAGTWLQQRVPVRVRLAALRGRCSWSAAIDLALT